MAKAKKHTNQKKLASKRAKKKAPEQPIEGLYQEAIRTTAAWFRNGVSEQKVGELLTTHFPRFTPPNVQYVIHQASQQIAIQYSRDRKNVVALHLQRYNQELILLQDFFRDKDYESIPMKFRKEIMMNKLNSWIDVLQAKESVLRMHSKDTQVKIFNKLNVKVKEKKVMFDLSKLSLEEKVEFLSLIQKTKKSEGEAAGVIMNGQVNKEVETEDVEHEVLEAPNVEQIKQYNIPVVAKASPKGAQTLDDITEKIKATLLKKAALEFKKVGAKKVAPSIIKAHE